jgi:acyl transferase domain-containing protein
VRLRRPRLPLLSSLTGEPAGEEVATPAYWCRQLRDTVQFARGIERLGREGCQLRLEIGPGDTLTRLATACDLRPDAQHVPSLRPGEQGWPVLLDSLAALYLRGVEVDWRGFDAPYRRRRLPLPTYPFQRQRHWVDTAADGPVPGHPAGHPLLSRMLQPTEQPGDHR